MISITLDSDSDSMDKEDGGSPALSREARRGGSRRTRANADGPSTFRLARHKKKGKEKQKAPRDFRASSEDVSRVREPHHLTPS